MRLTPIEVKGHAGAKADQTPRWFSFESQTVEVGEVLYRWYQIENRPEWPRADYLKVLAMDEREYLLKPDLSSRSIARNCHYVLRRLAPEVLRKEASR